MNRKLLLFLLLLPLLLTTPCVMAQQELQLSQYMFNGLTLNPALAGSHEAFNAQLLYRQQWMKISKAPMSSTGSVDGLLTQSNSMGWGLSLTGEQLGLMRTLGAYASYSFRVRLNKLDDRLSFGLSAGFMQENFAGVDFSATDSRGEPLYEVDDALTGQWRLRPDFRVGAYYSMGRTLYAGVSASNLGSLLNLDTLYNKNNPYIYFNLGGNFYLNDEWKLSPSTLATFQLNDRSSLDVNLALTYTERFWLGAGLRTTLPLRKKPDNTEWLNVLAIMAEVWVTQSLRLGYCYDYTLGRLTGVQNGSHEVSLGYTLARKITKTRSPRELRVEN